jgi:peptide chain release factor 1
MEKNMKRVLELKAGEGGADAKLFATDLAAAYIKFFTRVGWLVQYADNGDSGVSIEVTGADLSQLINESGGHRIQRIPPTERKGRVHTSTVTVAVIDPQDAPAVTWNERDFKIEWYSGTGCGGQHKNKHQNASRLTHLPTGIVATAQTRSRENSFKLAQADILEKVANYYGSLQKQVQSADKKQQVGSGMRGDKRRTYRYQDDVVKDHITGKVASVNKVLAGNFNLLW